MGPIGTAEVPWVEYLVTITFVGPPEPDDPRPLREQADEQIEGLGWFLADVGAHLEVRRAYGSTEGGD